MRSFSKFLLGAVAGIVLATAGTAVAANVVKRWQGTVAADRFNGKILAIAGTDISATAPQLSVFTASLSSSMDVAANVCKSSSAITVTGATVGDQCEVGPDATSSATNVDISCYVSAADAAKVKLCNLTAATINLNSGTYALRIQDR